MITITYDNLEQGVWVPNNTTSVNPVNFDYMDYAQVQVPFPSLIFMATYKKNLAGGLLSQDIPLLVTGKKMQYTAMNVKQYIPAYGFKVIGRNELDFKWTLVSGATTPLPNQANISTQINTDTGQWQLDPTGKAWVDTGYNVTPIVGQSNVFQIRAFSDGTTWSVTGLQYNNDTMFVPNLSPDGKTSFKNIPLITTNWTAGLHPQIQFEGINPPFSVTMYYQRIQLVISDSPIPAINPNDF